MTYVETAAAIFVWTVYIFLALLATVIAAACVGSARAYITKVRRK